MWFLDCFCNSQSQDFPVNSYFSESLEVVVENANRLLADRTTGIDSVYISQSTRGLSPTRAKGFADDRRNSP